jgi:hypothetical protein
VSFLSDFRSGLENDFMSVVVLKNDFMSARVCSDFMSVIKNDTVSGRHCVIFRPHTVAFD